MKTRIASIFLFCLALGLAGCGEGKQVTLTPEQEKMAKDVEVQVEKMVADFPKLTADLQKQATDASKQLADTLNKGLEDLKALAKTLRLDDGQPFEKKFEAVKAALVELGKKYADALAKSKIGDIKIPGL